MKTNDEIMDRYIVLLDEFRRVSNELSNLYPARDPVKHERLQKCRHSISSRLDELSGVLGFSDDEVREHV